MALSKYDLHRVTKYDEYKIKANQLDSLLALLTSTHSNVDVLRMGKDEFRLTRQADGSFKIESFEHIGAR